MRYRSTYGILVAFYDIFGAFCELWYVTFQKKRAIRASELDSQAVEKIWQTLGNFAIYIRWRVQAFMMLWVSRRELMSKGKEAME